MRVRRRCSCGNVFDSVNTRSEPPPPSQMARRRKCSGEASRLDGGRMAQTRRIVGDEGAAIVPQYRARLGSARLGSARLGSARLGSARLGSARLGSARLGKIIKGALSPFVNPCGGFVCARPSPVAEPNHRTVVRSSSMMAAMVSAPTAGDCVNRGTRLPQPSRIGLRNIYPSPPRRQRQQHRSHAPNRPGTSTRSRDGAGAVRFRRRSRQPREHAQSRLAARVISAAPSESFGLSAAVPVAPLGRARGNDMSLTSYPCGSMLPP